MEPLYTRRHTNVLSKCICSSLSFVWLRYKNYSITGNVVFIFMIYQILNTVSHESVIQYVIFDLPRIKSLIQWLMCHLSRVTNIHASDYSQTYWFHQGKPNIDAYIGNLYMGHKGNFMGLGGLWFSIAKWQKIKHTIGEIKILSTWTGFGEPINTLQFRKKTNTCS